MVCFLGCYPETIYRRKSNSVLLSLTLCLRARPPIGTVSQAKCWISTSFVLGSILCALLNVPFKVFQKENDDGWHECTHNNCQFIHLVLYQKQ